MPKKPEAQTTEYKSSWQEEYFEWIAGYANAEGGTLYIGVNDDGYVVGVRDTRSLLDKLPNQVASFLGITVSVDHGSAPALGQNLKYGEDVPTDIATKPVNLFARGLLSEAILNEIDTDPANVSNVSERVQALFDAAPGFVKQLRKTKEYRTKVRNDLHKWQEENPIYKNPDGSLDYVIIKVSAFSHGVPYHGRYYIRSGGTNQELKGAELSRFLYDKVGQDWDAVAISPVQLSQDALSFLREHAVEKGRLTQRAVSVSDETLLHNLQMLSKNGEYTRAASMLLGTPEDVVFGSYIRIGYFAPRLKFQDEVHGPLVSQPEKAVDLIYDKYLKGLVDIKGLYRTETYMTSRELLREVILNAVAHKYYPSNQPIQIKVLDDHITVMNVGLWPFDNLAVEDVYEGEHSSYQVNPLIAHGLFMAGVMDTWGQGFGLIKEECEKIDAPLPEIKATEKYITVTIRGCRKYMELLDSDGNLGTDLGTNSTTSGEDGGEDKTKMVLIFCEEPRSKAEIQEQLSIKSERYVREKLLTPLLKSGQLRRTIPEKPNSKNQKYISTKNDFERAQAIMDNNPVLQVSPGDLKREGISLQEYLSRWTDAEQAKYRDYYEDEI